MTVNTPPSSSSPPRWDPASGDIVEPAEAQKNVGFNTARMKPPRGWFNWFWSEVSGWLDYLNKERIGRYTDIPNAIAALDQGDTFLVQNVGGNDGAGRPWRSAWSVAHLDSGTYQGGVASMCCNGDNVFVVVVSTSGSPTVTKVVAHRANNGNEEWEYVRGGVSNNVICTDGARVFVGDSTTGLKAIDAVTGDFIANMSFSALSDRDTMRAIACDGKNLYVAWEDAGGSTAPKLDRFDISASYSTTPGWTWSGTVGEEIADIAIGPDYIYVVTDFGANENLYVIDDGTGAQYNEIDLDSSDGLAVACDAEYVYVATASGLYRCGLEGPDGSSDFDTLDSAAGDTYTGGLAIDNRYVARAQAQGSAIGVFRAWAKYSATARTSHFETHQHASLNNPARAVALDTQYMFCAGLMRQTTDLTLVAYELPQKPQLYTVASGTDPRRRFPNLIVVPE